MQTNVFDGPKDRERIRNALKGECDVSDVSILFYKPSAVLNICLYY